MKKILLVGSLAFIVGLTGCTTQATATKQYATHQANEKELEEILIDDENVELDTNVDLEEKENSDDVLFEEIEDMTEEQEVDAVEETKKDVEEIKEDTTQTKSKAQGVAIDAINFPDDNFRAVILNDCDIDQDGFLTQTEIERVSRINCSQKDIKSLEGIKIFKNLTRLDCYNNPIEKIDVSGMSYLEDIYYQNNNGLKTLDFRNCLELKTAYHSVKEEIVYISAGMTKYIGCPAVDRHTGNIVIDLDGYYTMNPDGSKSVDLTKVISQYLIDVLAKEDNLAFDKDTNILTIPAGEGKTEIDAGMNNAGESFTWTFYTNINAVDDVVVTFNTNGGTVIEAATITKGSKVAMPKAPTKDGFEFAGWYTDQECTEEYDFSTVVNADLTLYAKWEENTVVKPVDPVEPEIPVEPEAPVDEGEVLGETVVNEKSKTVKTADHTQILAYMMMFLLAGTVVLKTVSYRSKEKEE